MFDLIWASWCVSVAFVKSRDECIWVPEVVAGSWLRSEPGRRREFEEEAQRLVAEIKALQPQKGGLLGHWKADLLLNEWAPQVAHAARA